MAVFIKCIMRKRAKHIHRSKSGLKKQENTPYTSMCISVSECEDNHAPMHMLPNRRNHGSKKGENFKDY